MHTDAQVHRKDAMGHISTDQKEKLSVVIGADTVVQPEAVMIESINTLVTRCTVFRRSVCPFGTNNATEDFLVRLWQIVCIIDVGAFLWTLLL